jgi:hypothetical protein
VPIITLPPAAVQADHLEASELDEKSSENNVVGGDGDGDSMEFPLQPAQRTAIESAHKDVSE